jgi:predicted DNA-binding transcriptional regulator AlpA
MENNERLVFTINEFAKVTGISRNLAYSLARQDKLPVPVIHLGEKRMVVSRHAVERLLEGEDDQEGKEIPDE